MSATKAVVVTAAATILVVGGLMLAIKTDPPIIIGDGSVFLSHASIATNSPTQEEAYRFLHKVRTIKVIDISAAISQTVPVKARQWGSTSDNNRVRFDFAWH